MKKQILMAAAVLIFLGWGASLSAEPVHTEKWYTERWCALSGGDVWVRMADGGRCDCLTKTHAVEVAYAPQWADAVGWSLRAALQTGKKAGIVLIEEDGGDSLHRDRLNAVIEHFRLPISVWNVSRGGRDLEK